MKTFGISKALVVAACVTVLAFAGVSLAHGQDDQKQDKGLDIHSNMGDLHMGDDASPRDLGLPVYPGARSSKHDENRSNANLAIFTYAFGMKLLVANYDSDAAPDKVVAFYRDHLKKYGKVIECHSSSHGSNVDIHDDDKQSDGNKPVKCDGDNSGDEVDLKVGTENNQHVVSISPSGSGKGSTFALVYVRSRGKQGDI